MCVRVFTCMHDVSLKRDRKLNECFVAQESLTNVTIENSTARTKKDAVSETPWLYEYYSDNEIPVMASGDVGAVLQEKDLQVCAQCFEPPECVCMRPIFTAR